MDTRLAGLGIAAALVMSGCLRVHAAPNYETGDQNQSGEVLRWSFDMDLKGSLPAAATAMSGRWGVRPVPDAPSPRNTLCQTGTARSPALSLGDVLFADVVLTARFKPVSDHQDHAAGLLFRIQDQDNYYILRANALENNVILHKYTGGRRSSLRETRAQVASGRWQELRVEAVSSRLRGFLNGQLVVEVTDDTFQAGQVGLWTEADSVACFDDVDAWSPEPAPKATGK
jgi:hypothetical protein